MAFRTISFNNNDAVLARSGEVVIRQASWHDLRALTRLHQRSFRPRLAYRLPTIIFLWLMPGVHTLVAWREDEIAGCAIGDKHGSTSRVVSLCVEPEHRRQGIASLLLRTLEIELSHGDLVLMVESQNETAQSLYIKEGYRETGITRDYYGAGADGIWMRKVRT